MTSNEVKQKLQERREIVTDVIRHRKVPKRIPLLSQIRAWSTLDAGYKLSEGLSDLDKVFKAACRMQETYNFDIHTVPGIRFPYKVYEALGTSPYIFDDANDRIEYIDKAFMDVEDYPKLFEKGLQKFFFEDIFPRRFDSLGKMTNDEVLGHIVQAVKANEEFNKFCTNLNMYFAEHYGVPSFAGIVDFGGAVNLYLPIDAMMTGLRGIKGLIQDLRRNESDLYKACTMLDISQGGIKKLSTYQPSDIETVSMSTTMVVNTILNPKQFEKYCWPTWKAHFDAIQQSDGMGYIFTEGKMSHLIDLFRDIPENRFVLITEQDDIRDLRDKLPNFSFAGGISSYTLGHGTKQQCIDMAKKTVDEMGYDGRLMAATDKMLAFKNDAKGENLAAVNEFITEYSAQARAEV